MSEEQRDNNDWNGQERRGLPIHIINYIDSRMHDVSDQFNGKLDAIQEEIYHLKTSISSWMEKNEQSRHECKARVIEQCEKLVDEAIPAHPDNPDATPAEKRRDHRRAHASWIKRVDDEMEEWRELRKRIREWVVLGVLGVIGIAVWQYLLQGPK